LAKGDRWERAQSKAALSASLAATGAFVAGPVGAGIGAIAGLIIGDNETVFPLDMIAIPAYQAYLIEGTPSYQVYIRAGETLLPTGGEVADVALGVAQAKAQSIKSPKKTGKKRKVSDWERWMKNPKKKIYYKTGKKKGRLNLKAMGSAYRKAHGIKKR